MRRSALLAAAAILLVPSSAASGGTAANCSRTSVATTPLTDLGKRRYHAYTGGLYANGKNIPPSAYLKSGLAAARRVHPIEGRIVLLSIGMSNATQEFSAFKRLADADPHKSASVTIVDGAQGGQDAEAIKDPNGRYWAILQLRLAVAGVSADEVQAVWLKEAIARDASRFPADARRLAADLRQIIGILRARFPNLQLIYLSSRTYAGYATTPLNPEPQAYDSAFAVRWVVSDRIHGKLKGPWIGWGPYLWTNGTRGRKDGLVWTCADVRASDGTHPSPSGQAKVAGLLWSFFATSATAKSWFAR
jgi:hypothetical protein